MYGPPEEDGYLGAPHKPYSNNHVQAAHPNRGADYAPEVVESHGMEYNPAEPRSYPEAVVAPLATQQSRTPLPEYSSYNSGRKYTYHTKEGGGGGGHGDLQPPGSSHAVVISSDTAQNKRMCGMTRLVFFAVLSLLAVALVAVGLGVGLGVGLQHPHNNNQKDTDAAAASEATAAAASPTSGAAAIPSPKATVTPSKNANATCQAGIRYCGWDLIEQHRKLTDAKPSSSSSSFTVNKLANGISHHNRLPNRPPSKRGKQRSVQRLVRLRGGQRHRVARGLRRRGPVPAPGAQHGWVRPEDTPVLLFTALSPLLVYDAWVCLFCKGADTSSFNGLLGLCRCVTPIVGQEMSYGNAQYSFAPGRICN